MLSASAKLAAADISVPNASFESPVTVFVDIRIDSWQKSPKPAWYDESGGFLWTQLTGTFRNPPPDRADHLDNCDGEQAIWMFAVPEVGLWQDYDSIDGDDPAPTHAFNARFEVGSSYALTVGINGGGGGMSNGATMQISLYFRDGMSNRVTVAATTVTNSAEAFPTHTRFSDFQVRVPTVKPGDAWAGQNIGVLMISTVSSNLQGGYWDLDNVRLTSLREPTLTGAAWTDGQFRFNITSEAGARFEILASTNAALPLAGWTLLGTVTNLSGNATFIDTATNFRQRLYRARQLP